MAETKPATTEVAEVPVLVHVEARLRQLRGAVRAGEEQLVALRAAVTRTRGAVEELERVAALLRGEAAGLEPVAGGKGG